MREVLKAISGWKKDDVRYTPPEATQALVAAECDWLPEIIWEPACGDGRMARELTRHGHNVIASDIAYTGFGFAADFLLMKNKVSAIVTNPPFSLAARFIKHANELAPYVALLLKSTYWNAASRLKLYDALPCAAVYPLTWRLDFTGQGAPPMDCTWYVWDRKRWGARVFRPIPRPKENA